ncbi:Uncharacterised protein [Enterobacter cloacae]|nr:Uncharacterised protein [Enterobacter cloacae]
MPRARNQMTEAASAICNPEIAIRCIVPVSRIRFFISRETDSRSPIPSPRITGPH